MTCIGMKDFQTVLFLIIMKSFSIYVNIIQLDKTVFSLQKLRQRYIVTNLTSVSYTANLFGFFYTTNIQSNNPSFNQSTKTLTIYITIRLHTAACCIELNSSSASQKFQEFLLNPAVHYRVHYSPHILPQPVESTALHPISLRSVSKLCFHLCLGFQSGPVP